MEKRWVLNSNGVSFFTDTERARFDGADALKPALKFRSGHGLVADDGEGHLWCGDRIVATWMEPVAPMPVQLPPLASVPMGELDSLHVKLDNIRGRVEDLQGQLAGLQDIHATLSALVDAMGRASELLQPFITSQEGATALVDALTAPKSAEG